MQTKEVDGSLKLSDERKTEFSAALSSVKEAAFDQLTVGLWAVPASNSHKKAR